MNNSITAKKILEYIDKHGIKYKDENKCFSKKNKNITITKTKRGLYRKKLDLHGKTSAQAIILLREAIEDCKSKGINELLVIHGRGLHSSNYDGPVLKNSIREFLIIKCDPQIKSFTDALPKDGGEGATIIKFNK